MFDRVNPSKEVIKSISELIDKSVPKSEIFHQVSSKFPQCDKGAIAKGIASFIGEDVKRKYKIHSYLLAIFVIVSILSLSISPLNPTNYSATYYWVLRIFVSAISILFIVGFLRFKLFYYTTAVSIYSFYLLTMVYLWLVYPISFILILSSISNMVTLIYLYLLRKQVFPNIDFWGNVKKENGYYIFST